MNLYQNARLLGAGLLATMALHTAGVRAAPADYRFEVVHDEMAKPKSTSRHAGEHSTSAISARSAPVATSLAARSTRRLALRVNAVW